MNFQGAGIIEHCGSFLVVLPVVGSPTMEGRIGGQSFRVPVMAYVYGICESVPNAQMTVEAWMRRN